MGSEHPLPADAFARLGEAEIREITREMVERIARDPMIGFFFAKTDLVRLAELEHQHAAAFLGGPSRYEGRPLEVVHQPRRIFGGQFDRRVMILREVLERRGVPADLREAWLAHTRAQRDLIVMHADAGECD